MAVVAQPGSLLSPDPPAGFVVAPGIVLDSLVLGPEALSRVFEPATGSRVAARLRVAIAELAARVAELAAAWARNRTSKEVFLTHDSPAGENTTGFDV